MNRSALAFALSIAVLLPDVKAQAGNVTSRKSNLENSGRNGPTELSWLIQTIMDSGGNTKVANGLAQVVGLPWEMPAKVKTLLISRRGKDEEVRDCSIVYSVDGNGIKHPFCIYLSRAKRIGRNSESEYYRVSLTGQLEKVVTLHAKRDDAGKMLREGRSRFDESIYSPLIKAAFKSEMDYWLNDWLPKQKKASAR